MKTFLTAIATLLLASASTMPLGAQLRVTVEETRDRSVVGETIVFDAESVGQRVTKRLFVTFDPGRGSDVTLRDVRITPQGGEFSQELTDIDRLPVTIRNELRIEMFVSYLPRTPGPAQGVMQVVVELEGTGSQPSQAVYTVNLVGRVPAYSLSFMLPGSQARDLPVAGVLDFGNRSSGQATEAMLVLRNTGSAVGTVWSAAVSGSSAYSLSNPPAFPAQLEPGSSLAVQLAFLPPGTDVYRGDLTFDFGLLEQQYGLSGIGGDLLRYRLISYSNDDIARSVTDIPAGSDIVFGDGIASVGVVGLNTRRNAQVVRSISVTGPFALTEGPALPDTLGPQESFTARVEPRPTGVGDLEGSIVIGDVSFPLFFSVPDLSQVRFSREGGALSASERVALGLSVAAPYMTDVSGALELAFLAEDFDGDPAVQWATGGRQVAFTIPAGSTEADFGPSGEAVEFRSGSLSGEIVVTARLASDEWRFDLTPDPQPEVRFAVDVPDAPEVRFSREGGALSASERVTLGLSVVAPFVTDVSGTLELAFLAEDFDGDPAVQWATGGRQVAFTIPAGSTEADFGPSGEAVEFRSGSLSGEIVVTARLASDEWRFDLTPDPQPEVRFTVDVPDAPEVRFSRSGATVRGAEEVSLGMSIERPYPVEVTGALALDFVAEDFDGDPTVQWATGGRQVVFSIPAGETVASFGAEGAEVAFRAARVPGEMVVTASLRAEEWRLDLTPDAAPELRFAVEVPELPDVSFSLDGGTVGAAEQVALGVNLDRTYSTDIVGLLTLSFETQAFTSDPSVQWATGGRQVAFSIPRGGTAAIFRDLTTENAFQTGTVAGEIVVTARFVSVVEGIPLTIEQAQAQKGSLEITPDERPEARFRVMETAPVLRRLALGSTGQGRFTLQVTGFATSREVDSLSFAFSGVSGSSLSTPSLEADVAEAFRTYYGGNQSASFGSQFTATVEFSLDEGVFEDLASVSATAGNGAGSSNSVALNLN